MKRRLTMRTILSWVVPTQIALSPDGRWVAVVVRTTDWEESTYRYELRVIDIETGVTRTVMPPGKEIEALSWHPQSAALAFITDRSPWGEKEEKGIDKKTFPQVWVWWVSEGLPQPVTDLPRGARVVRWTPDGTALLVLTDWPKPAAEEVYDKYRKKRKQDEEVVDRERFRRTFVRVPARRELNRADVEWIYIGDYGIADFDVHPSGRWLVFTTNYTGRPDDFMKFDLWWVNLETGKAQALTQAPGPETRPRFSPDGRHLAFLALWDPRYSYARTDLVVIPFEPSTIPREQWQFISADADADVEDFRWTTDTTVWTQVQRGVWEWVLAWDIRRRGHRVRLGGERVVQAFDIAVQNPDVWVAVWENDTTLPDVWLYRTHRKPRRLTDLNPDFRDYAVAPQRVIQWKSFDGKTIEGLLIEPLQPPEGRQPPLLVAVHGGPHGRVTNTLRQYYYYQFFAAHGYAVLAPNFRGSSGYGHAFGIANFQDLGGGDFQDIMHGVDFVITQGWVDPDRLGIFGGSYGGYMTNWTITQTNRFKAAVSMFGIFNLISDFSNSYLPSWEVDYLGDYYWNDIERYLARSPARYVKNIETPVLIIHGKEDPNTFISNSKEMYQALRFLNKTVEFVIYPREEHGLEEPQHKWNEMRRVLAWFDRYVLSRERYFLGDEVTHEGWRLRVTRWDPVHRPGVEAQDEGWEDYELEVTIMPTLEAQKDRTLIIWRGGRSDFTVVLPDGTRKRPVAVLQKLWGTTAFLEGTDLVWCLTRGNNRRPPVSYALRLVFRIPRNTVDPVLEVTGFPPVVLGSP